jgi:hypothetical protein
MKCDKLRTRSSLSTYKDLMVESHLDRFDSIQGEVIGLLHHIMLLQQYEHMPVVFVPCCHT